MNQVLLCFYGYGMRAFYSLFFMLVFFWSCSHSSPNHADCTCTSFEIKEVVRTIPDCDEYQDCTSVKLKFPKISSGLHADRINEDILKSVAQGIRPENEDKTSVDELVSEFFNSYKEFAEKFPDTSYGWYHEVECEVSRLDSKVLALTYSVSSFTGGAHPNSNTLYYNYDLTTGEVIELKDMLKTADKAKLDEAVGTAFKKMKGIDTEVDLTELLRGYVDKFEANDNFLLKDDGVVFYYNSYEIAPYSEGPSKVFVSYADIPFFTKI
ncbi:DUF3298 domain-containing protein [Flammeovirgaceae bacterium SG7u.111]|nr:DUF3298 domain-containing protein [Flammeovirgaceae bacterium SG7u.132]WPO34543.1 DUF3298 domain-containing protein [Flammeovirgaceae bacterium SG7u.111]